jgi:predicted RNase H-like nuclease (RuvC/YqgF family)
MSVDGKKAWEQEEIESLRQRNSDLVTGLEACDEQVVALRQQLAAMEDKYLVERGMLRLKRAELADSQKQVTLLRDALVNIKIYADNIDDANNWCEEALAATEPK